MHAVRTLTVLALLVTATMGSGAHAADPHTGGSLNNADETIRWSGTAWGTSSPDAPTTRTACQNLITAVAQVGTSSFAGKVCDGYSLKINLPSSVWKEPGALQIGIHWEDPTEETTKDLDLFVYDAAGTLVGKSEGWVSDGESVMIPSAPNGDYLVVVARNSWADAAPDPLPYEAMAQVEYFPQPPPTRDLLPDLYPMPVTHLEFRTGAYLLVTPASATSCYPEEMLEQGARKCMRFNQGVANKGDAPFELRYEMPPSSAALPSLPGTEMEFRSLMQRIYRSDGTFRDQNAGTYTFHPTHGHFHYRAFAQSRLFYSDANGTRGALAKTGKKNGFCVADVSYLNFGLKGDYTARRYRFPYECNRPTEVDPTTGKSYLVNGITNGWGDNYPWFLADQFIEVSGLGDGYYVLDTDIDPPSNVTEVTRGNNCRSQLIRLTNMDVEQSKGEIIRDVPRECM